VAILTIFSPQHEMVNRFGDLWRVAARAHKLGMVGVPDYKLGTS
jgi:hypothetical protein